MRNNQELQNLPRNAVWRGGFEETKDPIPQGRDGAKRYSGGNAEGPVWGRTSPKGVVTSVPLVGQFLRGWEA